MISNNCLITIGITCFNAEKTIEKAINSALDQLWNPIEIIIVDDFSTDNGFEILKKKAEQYKEIRIFRNSRNKGVAYSRNRIIKNSRGLFLAFFDDDDISLPTRLTNQYQRIISYEKEFAKGNHVICHTARKIIYKNKKEFFEYTMGDKLELIAPNGIPVAKRILIGKPLKNGYGSIATCAQMARLETYKFVGGFDNSFRRSEDTELNIRLASIGTHFVGTKKVLVLQNMTNYEEKNMEIEIFYFKSLLKKHKHLMTNKEYEFSFKWLDLKILFFRKKFLKIIFFLLKSFINFPYLTFIRLTLSFRNIIRNIYFFQFLKKKF